MSYPRRDPDATTRHISIRLTPQERARWFTAMRAAGERDMSAWIRGACEARANKEARQ